MIQAPIAALAAGQDLSLLTTIAAGFFFAWLFGLITQRLGLSPIVGYLLAGVAIGPHTPGFMGDVNLALQLAEIGVILLMFGVGLHFHLKDLWAVRWVAIPGALGQSLMATVAAMGVFWMLGLPLRSGVVLGMAMAVASTVVLLRVLMDREMLSTSHGHVAVGWLVVEDILTVLVLVMVPVFGMPAAAPGVAEASAAAVESAQASGGATGVATLGWAMLKLVALVAIVLLAGSRVVPWILTQVAKLRSAELFTLTVLVLSIAIAVGSATIFGASVALGAFLAGLVVAQSPVSHQAAANALPMRDAFAVLFFVSVGMLFKPRFVLDEPGMVAAGLAVVLLVKPVAALAIVAICGYPIRTALTVAIGLAQIGEFSFILAQAAQHHGLLPEAGMHVLVASAMVSITLNPMLFRALPAIERRIERVPWLRRLLGGRHDRRAAAISRPPTPPPPGSHAAEDGTSAKPLALIVGYGPVGRLVDAMLRDAGLTTVIIDMNIDTVEALVKAGRNAVYGDATRREVLDDAGVRSATYLVAALSQSDGRADLVLAARELNPTVEITVRARYLSERDALLRAGADRVVFEEGETGVAMARDVLERRGTPPERIQGVLDAVRRLWHMSDPVIPRGSRGTSVDQGSGGPR